MKIRNGFVSNSSSSSFILRVPFYPESVDDVKRMLLGDENPLVLTQYGDEAFPTDQVMDIIYRDIANAIGKDKKRGIQSVSKEEISIGKYTIDDYDSRILPKFKEEYRKLKKEFIVFEKQWMDGFSDSKLRELPDEERWDIVNKLQEQMEVVSEKMVDIIFKSIEEKSLDTDIFVTVSYSDNDGSVMAYIEHSGILDPITVQQISHH